jgi:Lon protease-like protein
MTSPFHPSFEQLPARLPVFPLTGALLLPHARLPLRIFEPRYLAMTRAALAADRMIGMIQPQAGCGDKGDPPLYRIGCAGRIIAFGESDDDRGHFLITLLGVARFDIVEELPRDALFRTVKPDWSPYHGDLGEDTACVDRERLLPLLRPFLQRHKITVDYKTLQEAPADRIVTALSMLCPFGPGEKQALLEAGDTAERARLLATLIEMALHASAGAPGSGGARH